MKVIRADQGDFKTGSTFTGLAELRDLLPSQTPGGIKIALVHFEDGARTHWHEHPGEQVLYILEGQGRVGDEVDEWTVGPGDVVYTGPGERHWHGANPGQSMTHLSITNVGAPTWYNPPND
jgi:quercetin dioxygenase-like cupin family protein